MECLGTILEQFIESVCGTAAEARGEAAQLPYIHRLNESVYEFYSPPDGTTSNVEIVLFHGLEPGDYSKAYVETWTSFSDSTSCCWPQTWLAEKFPRARILSVSYDSSMHRGHQQGILDLYCTAENLLHDLMDMQGRVAAMEGCPLILVGKDLGGLVIKAICMEAKDQGRITFLSNLKGIFYYLTPHLGFLNWPTKFNGTLAKGLGFGNTDIVRLNKRFNVMRRQHKWAAKAIIPSARATKSQLAVSEASARFDVDECYTAKEDIDSICKPRARTSSTFTFLTGLISRFVGPDGGSLPEDERGELLSQSVPDRGETSRGIGFKPSLHFGDDRNYVPMQRTVAEVRRALQGAHIVLLHGGPGSGKSSLARYLALRYQDESRKQGRAVESTSDQTACFPGGVVLLTCGNGANIITKQRELLRKFDIEVQWRNEVELDSVDVRQKFHEKLVESLSTREFRALVVLDDVWDRDLVQNLLVPGGQVKYLLTTQVSTLWAGSDLERVKIQNVTLDDARQMLANYANFPGGVIPDNLKNLADDIIKAAESHPLALATLAVMVDSGERTSVREWQELKDRHKEYLTGTDHPAVIFGEMYPLSVHASMMLMVDLLDDDAKSLLYMIALFDGSFIPETLVRLFLMYTLPRSKMKNINLSRKSLEVRGVVQLEQEQIWHMTARKGLGELDRRVLWIHSLRHHFILTTKTEDIRRITSFLNDDSYEFLHLGERSSFDLATLLCSLYGAPTVKQRAVEKMGFCSRVIWPDETYSLLAFGLRAIVCFMFSEGETTSPESHIASAATEVLWKLCVRGEFDDDNITTLLRMPECSTATCAFLSDMSLFLRHTRYEPTVKALPCTINKLLLLLSDNTVKEVVQLCAIQAIGNFAHDSRNVIPLATQFPGVYKVLLDLLPGHVINPYIQELALLILAALLNKSESLVGPGADQVRIDMLAVPGLLDRLVVILSEDVGPRCWSAAAVILYLAPYPPAQSLILQVPFCIQRLAGLVTQDVDELIQTTAVSALACLLRSDDVQVRLDVVAIPALLERLVMFLSKDFETRCLAAVLAIGILAGSPSAIQLIIASLPSCLERLVKLLDLDVDKQVQELALIALSDLSGNHYLCMGMMSIPGLLEGLVMLLSKDMERTCELAASLIASLALTTSNVVIIAQFPHVIDRLVGLLAEDVGKSIQKHALRALAHLAISVEDHIRMDMLATPLLMERLVVLLSKDKGPRCEGAAATIANLASPPAYKDAIGQFPFLIEKLVRLLDQDVGKEIQEKALSAIASLLGPGADQVRIDVLAFPGLLDRLLAILSEDLDWRCMYAATAIGCLALYPPARSRILQVPFCVQRLAGLVTQDVDESIQDKGVRVLVNLLESNDIQVRLDVVAIPALLERLVMLLSKDLEVRCLAAVLAIRNLTNSPPEIRIIIAQFPSCLERLVKLLDLDVNKNVQWVALKALSNLLTDTAMSVPGLLERLVMLLSKDMENRCELAALLIADLALKSSGESIIAEFPHAIGKLVVLIGEDIPEEIQMAAVLALTVLTSVSLVDFPHLLPSVVTRLSANDMMVRFRSARTIVGLARGPPENKVLIAQFPHALERLVGLLVEDTDNGSKLLAVGALQLLALHPQNRSAMSTIPQLLESLVVLLPNELFCFEAVKLIISLDVLPLNTHSIMRYRVVIDGLAKVLSTDADEATKEYAAEAILIVILACRNRPDMASFSDTIEEVVKKAKVTGTACSKLFWYWSYAKAELKDYEVALMDITKALDLGGDSAFFWQERGVIRRLMGDFPAALADLNRSLEICPDNYEALKHRGLVKYFINDEEGARADVERALQVMPRQVDDDSYHRDLRLGVLPVEFGIHSLK